MLTDLMPDLPGALCAKLDADPDLWFTGPAREALAVCSHCPVRRECLAWAVEHGERGTWGATTEDQRQGAA